MNSNKIFLIALSFLLMYGCKNNEEYMTYNVRYDPNGATTGFVPIDNNKYETNQYVIVLDNSGELRKNNYLFAGWSTTALGSYGMDCEPNSQIQIKEKDLVLYAKWVDSEYDFDTVTGTITSYNFTYNDVIIPNELENTPVIIVGNGVFYGKGLRTVIVPESIIKLGIRSFANTRLTSVDIPSSVKTIDSCCFQECILSEVKLHEGIQYVNSNAFYENDISSIFLPDTILDIGERAFYSNKLSELILPNKIAIISKSAFAYNEITYLNIPNGINEIKEAAFLNNHLSSITLPLSIISIDDMAFGNNPITSISIGNDVQIYYNNSNHIYSMGIYGDSFYSFYVYKNKAAGHYLYNGNTESWYLEF